MSDGPGWVAFLHAPKINEDGPDLLLWSLEVRRDRGKRYHFREKQLQGVALRRVLSLIALYVLAAAMAGCSQSGGDLDTHPMREPDYGYVTPYGYSPSRSSSSSSKYDYYRNYRGTIHPGPEGYP